MELTLESHLAKHTRDLTASPSKTCGCASTASRPTSGIWSWVPPTGKVGLTKVGWRKDATKVALCARQISAQQQQSPRIRHVSSIVGMSSKYGSKSVFFDPLLMTRADFVNSYLESFKHYPCLLRLNFYMNLNTVRPRKKTALTVHGPADDSTKSP